MGSLLRKVMANITSRLDGNDDNNIGIYSVAKLRFAPNRGRFAPAIANVFGYFLLVVDKRIDICVHVSI